MSIPKLVAQNSFWKDPELIEEDKYIQNWEASPFKWWPRLIETIDWNIDLLYTLRGPRQVGKTTLLKLKIRDLIKREAIDARRIFYWSCDLVENPEKLVSLITEYMDWIGSPSKERVYIFLDEISSVRDWQRGVKFLYDSGKLRNCTLIMTGSHSIDIRKASESLAGRRGQVDRLADKLPDKILLPMKFSEYAETRSKEIYEVLRKFFLLMPQRRKLLLEQLLQGNMPNEFKELLLYSKELELLLQEYLITGGVPKAISKYVSHGSITEDVYNDYTNLVIRDILRWGGREAYLRQVLHQVIKTVASQVSWAEFAKETDLGSHNTVAVYMDILKDAFVVSIMYCLDKNSGRPLYRKNKKVHFLDPFIFHSLRAWALGIEPFSSTLEFLKEAENRSKLIECVVGNHLIRFLFNLFPSPRFEYNNKIFYWESEKKREVDFVAKINTEYLPIEVKYQPSIQTSNAYGIIDFTKSGQSHHGLIISKDNLEVKRSYVTIPCYIFLLLA